MKELIVIWQEVSAHFSLGIWKLECFLCDVTHLCVTLCTCLKKVSRVGELKDQNIIIVTVLTINL